MQKYFQCFGEEKCTPVLREAHFQTIPDAQFPKLAELSAHKMIPPIKCQLCDYATSEIKPNIDPEINRHIHQFSIGALPWETRAEGNRSEEYLKDKSSYASTDKDKQDLGMSLHDEFQSLLFLDDTGLSIELIQSRLYAILAGVMPQSLPKHLIEVLDSNPPKLREGTDVERVAPGLVKICCILFQLQRAENPSNLSLGFPKQMISEFHSFLQDELQDLVALLELTAASGEDSQRSQRHRGTAMAAALSPSGPLAQRRAAGIVFA